MDEFVEDLARSIKRARFRATRRPGNPNYFVVDDQDRTVARAVLADINGAGYVIVPREPTDAMIGSGDAQYSAGSVWRSMIHEALKPSPQPHQPSA